MKQDPPANLYVSDGRTFNEALLAANGLGPDDMLIVTVMKDITIGSSTVINTAGTLSVEAVSGVVTISGISWIASGLRVASGRVQLSDLVLRELGTKGQYDGGLGSGGGLFVGAFPPDWSPAGDVTAVTLQNVSILDCVVTGENASEAGGLGGSEGKPGDPGPDVGSGAGWWAYSGPGGAAGAAGPRHGAGEAGGQGAAGGYGAGGGAGGGGGGAGSTDQPGGVGGLAGPPGFGGAPVTGGPPPNIGPQGGAGQPTSAGAGLGGGIYVMPGASVIVQGAGRIAGNRASGGIGPTNGTSAGGGVFMQGSGMITFTPEGGSAYVVADPIADESGTVLQGLATPSDLGDGPDGLPQGGGTGAWGLNQTGDGVLRLDGPHMFSGPVIVSAGQLDLSNYQSLCHNDVTLSTNTQLAHQPPGDIPKVLSLRTLEVDPDAQLVLNSKSIVSVRRLVATQLTLALNPKEFPAHTAFTLVKVAEPMSPLPTVTATGFTLEVQSTTITVKRDATEE